MSWRAGGPGPAVLGVFLSCNAAAQTHDQTATYTTEFERLLRSEPGVSETQAAALEAGGFDDIGDRDWVRAARRSAGIPERVAVDGGWRGVWNARTEQTYTGDFDELDVPAGSSTRDLVREDGASQLEVGLLVQWDLRGLAWGREEEQAIEMVLDLAAQRTERLLAVTEAYFLRRAALLTYLDPGTGEIERISAQLAVEAATAALDSWTDGWYSMELIRRSGGHVVR